MQESPAPLRFGRYTLHPARRQLLADGVALPIGSRAFDLLEQLLRHAGRPVSSEDLRRAVWPDRQVGSNNLRVQITALRKLLGDGVIAHHTTRGYRFTLPVQDEAEQAASSEPAPPGNLPLHLPPMFGRDADRLGLVALLTGQARVTLAGPAGVGKTLLAQATAHDRRRQHADGVWWVELAALSEPAQLAYAAAALLQIKLQGQEPITDLARALSSKRLLLVLDNCEHLTRAACDLADALLRHAPQVAVLATSRRSIKCAGEQVLRLGPLGLPDDTGLASARRSGAVALFEARARRADPAFALTEANVDAVSDICRQLDGVALAINLAAARVPLLGVAGLRERLNDRLRLLSSREPDARGHPQALNAALDWSHGLLDRTEQAVLRRLGVFAGSFGLASAQALAGDEGLDVWAVLDALNALIDHSLLLTDAAALQSTATARYTLHESVRLYARARLEESGEAPALRGRHARHVLALLTGTAAATGSAQPRRDKMDIRLADADHDNLRAALSWAFDHDIELALQLSFECSPYMRLRCHHPEARRLGSQLLDDERTAAHPLGVAKLRSAMAALCFEQNELDAAMQHAQAVLTLLADRPDDQEIGDAYSWIGSLHCVQRRFDLAEPALRLSMDHQRAANDLRGVASQMNNLALVMMESGRHDEARHMLRDALDLNRRIQSTWGTAMTLVNLGELAYAEGDCGGAQAHWREALPLVRRTGHVYQEALVLFYLGQALRQLGQPEAALAQLHESLRISLPQRMPGLVADSLTVMAGLLVDGGQARRAAMLLRVADQQRAGGPLTGPVAKDFPSILAATRHALSAAQWHAACAEGDRLTPEQAIA